MRDIFAGSSMARDVSGSSFKDFRTAFTRKLV